MNESNRRIASRNRIDELTQRIAFQNDPKRPVDSYMARQDRPKRAQELPRGAQDPLKTAQKPPKTLPRGPKSSQERPKTPPRRPKTPPGALLERSWRPSWDHPITRSKSRPSNINLWKTNCRLWSPKRRPKRPQIIPKASQKSRRKMHHFFIALGAVLDRS